MKRNIKKKSVFIFIIIFTINNEKYLINCEILDN